MQWQVYMQQVQLTNVPLGTVELTIRFPGRAHQFLHYLSSTGINLRIKRSAFILSIHIFFIFTTRHHHFIFSS